MRIQGMKCLPTDNPNASFSFGHIDTIQPYKDFSLDGKCSFHESINEFCPSEAGGRYVIKSDLPFPQVVDNHGTMVMGRGGRNATQSDPVCTRHGSS
jgi:hypothetical protein